MTNPAIRNVAVAAHPSLDARLFWTQFPRPLAELPSDAVQLGRAAEALPPPDDTVRRAVRDMLRHDGYKPTGRGKPSSEYLTRAASEAGLSSINAAVDACNAVSLHSGLPISVVDTEKLREPLVIRAASAGGSYVFNASGQVIDVSDLLCLHDAEGPCANAVKDAQRTKTSPSTQHTLSVVWGARQLGPLVEQTLALYRSLLERSGAVTIVAPARAFSSCTIA